MTTPFISKLGKTKAGERTRIWLEGQRLIDAGFEPGAKFVKRWTSTTLVLVLISKSEWDETEYTKRGTVSGKRDKPVIDIVGAVVNETFGDHTHIKIIFSVGVIKIGKQA